MPAVQKVCCVCGDDVSAKKRVKDAKGRYYCEPCQTKALQSRSHPAKEAAVAVSVAAAPAAVAAPPAPPPAADDGMLDLAPVRDHGPPKDAAMFGCSSCKKLVPERQIRNIDGEFICNSCFSKRSPSQRPAAKSKPSAKAAKVAEEEVAPQGDSFAHSLTGGAIISAGVLVAGFAGFFGMLMAMPLSKGDGAFAAGVYATLLTIYVVIRAGILLLSMVVAGKMMGGISFGFIGSALYKSLGLCVVLTAIGLYGLHNEDMDMLFMGIGGVLVLVAFLVLFRIDFFEAIILCVVNNAFSFLMMFVMPILLLLAAESILGQDEKDFGKPGRGAPTAPAVPGAPGAPADPGDGGIIIDG